jgi:hypothetical protein
MAPDQASAIADARIGVDVGGTFTDVVLALADGRIVLNKTTTTPRDPGEGVVAGIDAVLAEAGLDPARVAEIVHGTTVASNTILQKVGARTGLLTTGRLPRRAGDRAHPHARHLRHALEEAGAAGRPRRWRLEVAEPHRRRRRGGRAPLDEAGVRAAADALLRRGVEAVAVCLHQQLRRAGARAPRRRDRCAPRRRRSWSPSSCRGAARDQGVRAHLDRGRQRLPACRRLRVYLGLLTAKLGERGIAAPGAA